MSKKQTKRSDQRTLEEKFARRKRAFETISPLPPRTMIFCEGTKTEPHYIQAIVDEINQKCRDYAMGNRIKLSGHIQVIGTGRSTTSLLSYAVRNTATGTQEVWLVYDHDDFPSDQFNATPRMADSESKKGGTRYHTAWSNESFELWLLLHFIPLVSNISRDEYINKLVEYIPGYHKSATDVYSRVKDRVSIAIKNARTLEAFYDSSANPSDMAPCTKVHLLVEELLFYL